MRLPIICALVFSSCLLAGAAAVAQEQAVTVPAGELQPPATTIVKTNRDRVLVWRRNPSQVLTTLPAGVELEAIARDSQWYQVRVPEKYAGAGGAVGFVYKGHVEKLSGPEPPALPTVTDRTAMTKLPAPPPPAFRARGYASGAYQWFLANDSFKAILDKSSGFFYGGGGQAIFHNIFVDVGWEQFKKSGSRVAVVDGEVFPLGIKDTITMQPFRVTGGYRFRLSNGNTAYAGGGAGSMHFKEVSEFAEPGENTDERFGSWNLVGGTEVRAMKYVFFSVEFRYESVPNAVGAPGVAGEFGEKDLGGFGIGVKVLVGR
jgi:opacity protein-like surface antigen